MPFVSCELRAEPAKGFVAPPTSTTAPFSGHLRMIAVNILTLHPQHEQTLSLLTAY